MQAGGFEDQWKLLPSSAVLLRLWRKISITGLKKIALTTIGYLVFSQFNLSHKAT